MRPNRNRRKLSVCLGQEDLNRAEKLCCKPGINTLAAAIRHALDVATTPPQAVSEPPDTTKIGLRILQWAESRLMCSQAEKRELRILSRDLYDIVQRTAGGASGGATTVAGESSDNPPADGTQ
jgi:hypothetical protein